MATDEHRMNVDEQSASICMYVDPSCSENKKWGRPSACGGLSGRLLQIDTQINSGAESPAQAEGLPHKTTYCDVRKN